jgi:PleD family two-component response regulator
MRILVEVLSILFAGLLPLHEAHTIEKDRTALVLVVEDSPVNRKLLQRVLGRAGYTVIPAENAEHALHILRDTVPDIVLLDVVLPGMDGLALCRQLKEDDRLSDIPVLFITAKTTTQDIVLGFEAGGVDYVPKPFNRLELLARVRTHIRLHQTLVEIDRLRQLALDANPLTHLPGNNSIAGAIRKAIEDEAPVTVIYCDLDNFKAYNDRYGFSEGDRVISFTADLLVDGLKSACGDQCFVGHIGGDDFVVIVPSEAAQRFGDGIVSRFDEGVAVFYSDEDRAKGGITAVGRTGQVSHFPIVTISMGGVDLTRRNCHHFLEVAALCAEVKQKAKSLTGSAFYIDQRTGE